MRCRTLPEPRKGRTRREARDCQGAGEETEKPLDLQDDGSKAGCWDMGSCRDTALQPSGTSETIQLPPKEGKLLFQARAGRAPANSSSSPGQSPVQGTFHTDSPGALPACTDIKGDRKG